MIFSRMACRSMAASRSTSPVPSGRIIAVLGMPLLARVKVLEGAISRLLCRQGVHSGQNHIFALFDCQTSSERSRSAWLSRSADWEHWSESATSQDGIGYTCCDR